ncbi:hypothetical protein GCM10010461_17820 [Microbacterium aurantiacum]
MALNPNISGPQKSKYSAAPGNRVTAMVCGEPGCAFLPAFRRRSLAAPAHLGGSAPTPEVAAEMEAERQRKRAAEKR